jgi:glycosyltransferase involved in cell wall biosynthesis
MKLSIIIPVYNVEKYVARCIDSLLCQDIELSDYEIIIVDDGCTDKSISIAQKYLEKASNIHIHSQINAGVGAARNKGIDLAQGKFVYFIDPDDYLAKGMLCKLVDYIEKHKLEVLTFLSETTPKSDLAISRTGKIEALKLEIETGVEYIGDRKYKNEIWWYLIDRTFLKNTGIRFIEGRWMEDAIFTANIFLKSKRMAHVDIDVHRHVVTPQSAMTSKENKHYLKVIRDNAHAAFVFKPLVESFDNSKPNFKSCIKRLKTRQQSFVFFMLVRMLKSRIKLSEIKAILKDMTDVGAYPLNSFLGKDYNQKTYFILVPLFNKKNIYYLMFLTINPIFKLINYVFR